VGPVCTQGSPEGQGRKRLGRRACAPPRPAVRSAHSLSLPGSIRLLRV
jgi:hypothetical protein